MSTCCDFMFCLLCFLVPVKGCCLLMRCSLKIFALFSSDFRPQHSKILHSRLIYNVYPQIDVFASDRSKMLVLIQLNV